MVSTKSSPGGRGTWFTCWIPKNWETQGWYHQSKPFFVPKSRRVVQNVGECHHKPTGVAAARERKFVSCRLRTNHLVLQSQEVVCNWTPVGNVATYSRTWCLWLIFIDIQSSGGCREHTWHHSSTCIWCFFTMFRLGTGKAWDFRGGDWGLGLIHGDVVGLGTGDWRIIHGDVMQWTNNHLGWELRAFSFGDWGLGTYTWRCCAMNKQPFRLEDWRLGLIHGDVAQWTNNHLGWRTGDWGLYMEMLRNEQSTI